MPAPESLRNIVLSLPDKPGIYQYLDKEGVIIYVGKAKNLKRRVSSYFTKTHENRKTALLVRAINSIRHIVVETEEDALILENNLIKKYQPRYNIRLKDDKTYPWIVIKNESFPRVFYTRKVIKDGSAYFGPFTSMYMVRTLIELFRKIYLLRTCNYDLSDENVSRGKYKICLEYHIKNCKGPCESHQSKENYIKGIDEIKHILKGNIQIVVNHLKQEMIQLSSEMNFEEAHEVKEKLEVLQNYQSKSTVVSPTIRNVDVFAFRREENEAYVNFLKVVNGGVIQSFTLEIKQSVEESDEDLLLSGITEIRQKIFSNSKELLVPFKPKFELKDVKYTVPQRGDKRKLLELSEKNLKYYILEKKKSAMLQKKETSAQRILSTAQKDLRLKELPVHIECFDNSNIQGSNPVAACVVFRNSKPAKRDYRHFNIKTVEGPDDFASMTEIVYRRYKRLLNEKKSLPNLIVIDGGKGQLHAALNALDELGLRAKIPIIGIAKKLEEIYYPGDSVPLYIDKTSETLKLIQKLRDEAHRFGITHHRSQRSKDMIVSELDGIKGIGEKTKERLLKMFKSVEGIKKARFEEIVEQVGQSKAMILKKYFEQDRE